MCGLTPNCCISIHAPRGGSDILLLLLLPLNLLRFQSTLPVGGATAKIFSKTAAKTKFQSTLPVGGATNSKSIRSAQRFISIHAPRGGSDIVYVRTDTELLYFNPRSPWGERQQRYTNFKVHLWQRGRIFAFLREERRDSHQEAALRDRFFDGNLGANLPAFSVYYGFAVRESRCPPANSCSCSQNAPPSFRTGYPGSKTAASPFRHP